MGTDHLGTAAMIAVAIKWAQTSDLPILKWFDEGSVVAARLVSLAAAAATAAGLVVGIDGNLLTSATLTVGNLSVWTAAGFLGEMFHQFSLQEFARLAMTPHRSDDAAGPHPPTP